MKASQLSKGARSRIEILKLCRLMLNEQGPQLRLADLAKGMGRTVSHITNHFPGKDHLYVAIAQEYTEALRSLTATHQISKGLTLESLISLYSDIMDLQYEYRSIFRAVASTSHHQELLYDQITASYRHDKAEITRLLQACVEAKILEPGILEPEAEQVFVFQYVTLFTTWVVSMEIYDKEQGYPSVKPVYLKGIMQCMAPYFTAKAKKVYAALEWGRI